MAAPGPTTLADLRGLTTPAAAPRTLRFSPAMTAMFAFLDRHSFPGGHAREQGGTIVADRAGHLSIQNVGGLASGNGSFVPNVMLAEPTRFRLVGSVHTHPYERREGGMTGVSFSGGDVGNLIRSSLILAVVQAGPRLFAYVRTALTPATVDYATVKASADVEQAMRVGAGQGFAPASRTIAAGRALQYGLAYYEGAGGIVTRV